MQGVFTKFLQLWIPNKTDKGSVVTDVFEPNFTKLDQNAETTNKTLTDLGNNKLDKGTYPGKASDLNTEISKIASTTQLGRMIVGKGMTADSTGQVSIVSENDGIIVEPGYIKLNVYNGVTGTSGIRAASAVAVKTAYDKALEASNNLINKLDRGTYSGNASNLKSEIDSNLNKIIGLEYDGELNNNNLKEAEKAYWDNTTRSIYKCLVDNNLNYPESTKYIAISNDDFLIKIQSLCRFYMRRNGDLIMNISLIENFCIVSFFIEATSLTSEFYFRKDRVLIDLFAEFGVKIQNPFQGTIGIIQGITENEKKHFYIRCNEDGKLTFVGDANINGKHGTFGTICFALRK